MMKKLNAKRVIFYLNKEVILFKDFGQGLSRIALLIKFGERL